MKNCFYALSKRGGGMVGLGHVADRDWLYQFEAACPSWTESTDIFYDEANMRALWLSEDDLWIILPGEPSPDEPETKRFILSQVFSTLVPLAVIRTASFLHAEENTLPTAGVSGHAGDVASDEPE